MLEPEYKIWAEKTIEMDEDDFFKFMDWQENMRREMIALTPKVPYRPLLDSQSEIDSPSPYQDRDSDPPAD